jgi:GT2 family glycosyltransferase
MMSVSVIILAYGEEPELEAAVRAAAASRKVDVEVLVVDNGYTDATVLARLEHDLSVVRVLRPGHNLGFAGGCNYGARHASGAVIALINGDAFVEPEALARLADVAMTPDVGIATASLRLASDPERMNSAGNPVHFLGFSWAGGLGEPAERHTQAGAPTSASGAAMAMRRTLWVELGGFATEYFAYHEDTELSLRCWQRGLSIQYVPDAVVRHRYEFSRNPDKLYLLERNRLLLVLTVYQRRTLVVLAPLIVTVEAAMLLLAIKQGWWRQKLRGWRWVGAHLSWVRQRRALIQRERLVGDHELAPLLEGKLRPEIIQVPRALSPFNTLVDRYWSVLRRLL